MLYNFNISKDRYLRLNLRSSVKIRAFLNPDNDFEFIFNVHLIVINDIKRYLQF